VAETFDRSSRRGPHNCDCQPRHFKPEHLEPYGVRALHPQSFLIEIFREEQALVMTKLEEQAADRGRSLRQLLDILSSTVPEFVARVSDAVPQE
jgi:hypothetical protein